MSLVVSGLRDAIQADHRGAVAELADALDLGSSSLRSAGSIPVSPIWSFS